MNRIALVAVALAVPLAAAAQVRPGDLQRGLAASFQFDGDTADAVTRTPANAFAVRPTEGRNGGRDGALWFDGMRSYVNLGARVQPGRFTISAWIRPDVVDRVQVIASKIRNVAGHYQRNFELRLSPGGRLFLHVPSGAGWEAVEGARPLAPGAWTHVAAVYDGARAQLYVDGIADGPPLMVRYQQSQTEIFLGARPESGRDGGAPGGPTYFFRGAIDDVQIWDRPLSEGELAVVSGRAPFAPEPPPYAGPPRPPPPPPAAVAPLAIYPLDGDGRDALGGPEGQLVGTRPADDRAGNRGAALSFTGKDHVDLGIRTEPERFSLAVWVRANRGDKEQVILSKLSTSLDARQAWLEMKVEKLGRISLTVPNASPFASTVKTSQRIAPGRWVHVAATYDGQRAVVYLDGAPAGEAELDPFSPSRGPVFVGARPDPQGRRARFAPAFDGRLDDLRIYRGALSPNDVALIARGDVRPSPPPGRGDDEASDLLLVKVDQLLVRYDAVCARRDVDRIGRVEERVASEIQEAARAARGDRELVERLHAVAREFERGRGHADAMSLDRKRSALASLSDALWADLARDLDGAAPQPATYQAPGGGW